MNGRASVRTERRAFDREPFEPVGVLIAQHAPPSRLIGGLLAEV